MIDESFLSFMIIKAGVHYLKVVFKNKLNLKIIKEIHAKTQLYFYDD